MCVFCRLNSDVAYASMVNLNLLFWTQHGHGVVRFPPIRRTSTNIFTQSWQGSNALQLNVNQFFHAREIIIQQKSGLRLESPELMFWIHYGRKNVDEKSEKRPRSLQINTTSSNFCHRFNVHRKIVHFGFFFHSLAFTRQKRIVKAIFCGLFF